MRAVKFFFVGIISFNMIVSCTDNDDQVDNKIEIYITGGEIDDPVEPDRED